MDSEIKMTLRIPDDMRDRLARTADRNRRSMHAQILVYVERGLDQDKIPDQDQEGRS